MNGVKVISDIRYGADDGFHVLDLYLPEGKDEFLTMIYIHGGGLELYTGGLEDDGITPADYKGNKIDSKKYLPAVCADQGIAIATVDYRLYPDAKYPEFIEDVAQATAWVMENIHNYGKSEKFVVCGSSAGAYLAMMLCFDKKYLGKYGIDSYSLAGYIFDGGQPTAHFNTLRERGINTKRVIIDETAPMYHLDEVTQNPPLLFIVAEHDLPNRYEQNQFMLSVLKYLGYRNVEYITMPGYGHSVYCWEIEENGTSKFGNAFKSFIQKL